MAITSNDISQFCTYKSRWEMMGDILNVVPISRDIVRDGWFVMQVIPIFGKFTA
jgi:hypothetical protein